MKIKKFCARCNRLAIHKKRKSPYCKSCEDRIAFEEEFKKQEKEEKKNAKR